MSGDANSRKRKYCWNNAVKQKSVEAGISGLFMTCDNHEKQAIAEAYNIIDTLMDNTSKVPESEGKQSDDEDDDEDVADSLKRVCDEARGGKIRRCRQRPTGVKNCIFVTVQDADVVELAERMVTYAQSSRQCRYLQRVLPVEETADVNLKKLNDMITKCVEKHLKARDDGSVPSYALEFKARNNDSIKKSDVLEMLGDAVNVIAPKAKVDLAGADVTFMVQLVRKTMMVAGIPNYYLKRKYNMHPKEEKPESEKAPAEAKVPGETVDSEDQKDAVDDSGKPQTTTATDGR
ncbi:THUMP domain-containing protein [Trichostrongylus colubriformis]|uniref:THUMP domain-containing protein n=1 Tax=Trichostrongylus colubriformis TaxID=6319 RepID=A0AAN8FY43_TRICO